MSRKATIVTDDRGTAVAAVPLGKKAVFDCILDIDSYEALLNAGYSSNWSYYVSKSNNKKYVTVSELKLNRNRMVARLIVGAGESQMVKYRNGNTCDLRKINLIVVDNQR